MPHVQAKWQAACLVSAFVAAEVAASAAGVQEELALVHVVLISEIAGSARISVDWHHRQVRIGDSPCIVTIARQRQLQESGSARKHCSAAHPPDSTTDWAPMLDCPAMPATCGRWAPHWRQSMRSFHHSPTRTPCSHMQHEPRQRLEQAPMRTDWQRDQVCMVRSPRESHTAI